MSGKICGHCTNWRADELLHLTGHCIVDRIERFHGAWRQRMSDFLCNKSCPNRNSFGYCNLTTCNQIRWMVISEILTDKVSSDCCGSIAGHLTERAEKDETNN